MKTTLAIIIAALAAIAAPAAAITVDFDEMANDNFFFSPGNVYVSQGYRFTNDASDPTAYVAWGRSGNAIVYNADANPQTGTTLTHGYNNTITTISRVDGAAFTLSSLFIADAYNTGSLAPGGPVDFTFTTAAGTTTDLRILDSMRRLQAEIFNRSGLLSFTIGPRQYNPPNAFPVAGLIQIDNVGLTLDATSVGGVPEPQSWAMVIAGFGLAGAAMRRRRVAVISA
jgi:hypothetical protein